MANRKEHAKRDKSKCASTVCDKPHTADSRMCADCDEEVNKGLRAWFKKNEPMH